MRLYVAQSRPRRRRLSASLKRAPSPFLLTLVAEPQHKGMHLKGVTVIDPIVSEEKLEMIQERPNSNKARSPRNTMNSYPLRGMIHFEVCPDGLTS